jgi:hypothetical protein
MNTFQNIVLFVAIVILIIALVIIGIALTYAKNTDWPPMIPACPDYWLMDGSGNNATCKNIKDLGTCPPNSGQQHLTMNFNVSPYTGSQGACNKYNWANNCGVSWDGITYGVTNPCQVLASSSSSSSS